MVNARAGTTVFVYSSGKLVAEYSTAAPPTNPSINYTTTDHLGSPRVITNALGQVTSRRDFLPFGEDIVANVGGRTTALKYGTTDTIRQKFTGYQKDEETSLDFAEARMYENRYGRFTAVDPLLASGKSAAPQSFNRYLYISNNPVIVTDPSGRCPTGQCPDTYTGTVYTDGNGKYDNEMHDGWKVFSGDIVLNGASGTIGGSGTFRVFNFGEGSNGGSGWYRIDGQTGETIGGILSDTGIGMAKWGYNTLAGASNAFYTVAGAATWEFVATGTPRQMPSVAYYEYANQNQANAAISMTISSMILPGLAESPKPISITLPEGFSVVRSSARIGTASVAESTVANFARPSWRSGTAETMWEQAPSGPQGGRLCPTCGREVFWEPGQPRSGLWDIDHFDPRWSQRSLEGLTRKEVIDNYHKGIRFRCTPCNRADNQ